MNKVRITLKESTKNSWIRTKRKKGNRSRLANHSTDQNTAKKCMKIQYKTSTITKKQET